MTRGANQSRRTIDEHVDVQRYQNRSGDSGVTWYEIQDDSIVIQFRDGWKYEYTNASSGVFTVRKMKLLARSGRGLSTFVSQFAKQSYERKFR